MSAGIRPGHGGRAATFGGPFRVQMRVLSAMILREMSTRFGRDNLGYLWLFLEPAMLGGAIGLLHHLSGHGLPGGLSPFEFWVMGYVPFYMFRGVLNRAPSAIIANQSLLYHRHITVLDILLARNLLEGAATTVVMIVFQLLFGMVLGNWPADPFEMLAGMIGMFLLVHGTALLVAAGSIHTELFDRLMHLLTYLTMPLTGAFFMVFWLPTDVQAIASWIPTVHIFEMIRHGQFGDTVPTSYDPLYLGCWIAGVNLVGMAALRQSRRALVL